MKVSLRVSELQIRTLGSMLELLQFMKGLNSIQTVGGHAVVALCTIYDRVRLYICTNFCENISVSVS